MSNKKSLGLILVVLGFVLIALTGIRTISNPEIFTHIALGQAGSSATDPLSYTMADQKWVNMSPLYNKLAYGLWTLGGAGLVTTVHVAIVLASFILLFRFGKKWGGPLSQGLALLLCTWLLLPVFNPGPAAFFLLFTALFLTLLYRIKNFNLLAALLLILQLLWTNMHPSFLFGPILILFFAIENWQETRGGSRAAMVTPLTNRLFALSAIALLVTLINPNLINLHRHVLSNWKVLTGTDGLEWISLFSSGFPQTFIKNLTVFSLVLGAGGLITLQKKLPTMITMLALLGAFLTVRSIGSLQAFALLAFPFLVLSFDAIGEYLSRSLTTVTKISENLLHGLLAVVALILMVTTAGSLITNGAYINMGSASRFGLGVQEDAFPVAAAGILERADFPARMINLAHDGGYLSLQNPQRKIFCDTRTSFYGTDFYKTLNSALLGQAAAWKTILSDWNPHAIVLNGAWMDSGALANRLVASRAWKLVYFDGATILLVRDLPEYASLINDPSIQKYGLSILETAQQKYKTESQGLFKTGNSSRLIGAGGLYLALNRPAEAETAYALLTKNSPSMATAWLGLGQSMILQKQISKGIGYMEQAAAITPSSSRVWMGLLQAYRMKGDEGNA
ncbi:MAG: hypothetical protein JEZ10_08885, partial [Verrucomicrobia bacterium]|nr:hypothetical protein [Verrucomicrobiota bacterium]